MDPVHQCRPTVGVCHHSSHQGLYREILAIGEEDHSVDCHACLIDDLGLGRTTAVHRRCCPPSHTLPLSLSLSLSNAHIHANSPSLSLTHTHTHTHMHTLSFVQTLSLSLLPTHTLIHTHTHTHTPQTPSLNLKQRNVPSFKHTCTRKRTQARSLTHT